MNIPSKRHEFCTHFCLLAGKVLKSQEICWNIDKVSPLTEIFWYLLLTKLASTIYHYFTIIINIHKNSEDMYIQLRFWVLNIKWLYKDPVLYTTIVKKSALGYISIMSSEYLCSHFWCLKFCRILEKSVEFLFYLSDGKTGLCAIVQNNTVWMKMDVMFTS